MILNCMNYMYQELCLALKRNGQSITCRCFLYNWLVFTETSVDFTRPMKQQVQKKLAKLSFLLYFIKKHKKKCNCYVFLLKAVAAEQLLLFFIFACNGSLNGKLLCFLCIFGVHYCYCTFCFYTRAIILYEFVWSSMCLGCSKSLWRHCFG